MIGTVTPPSPSTVRRSTVHRWAVRVVACSVAMALLLMLPAIALAHPLGNFTINHYAGIRVDTDRVALDVVIDQAEIPTFTERQRIDTDGDGQVSDPETEAERQVACSSLASSLTLAIGGSALALSVEAAGLSFPAGAGGLSTMRLVCEYATALPTPLTGEATVHFADRSNAGRIGWREIVATGDGVTIAGATSARSVSARLTSYPQDLLAEPLSTSEATLTATPGGASWPVPCIADAFALTASPTAATPGFGCEPGANRPAVQKPEAAPVAARVDDAAPAAAVPGGVGTEISSLLQTRDLTPPIVIVSLLTAMGLGAAHALTPGHGKTVMAAYLVGTRGTARQAVGLGLTVTIAHTVGVLLLAVVVLSVSRVTPEAFNHATGIVSGLLVLGIGGWLFVRQGLPIVRMRLAQVAGHRDEHGQSHTDSHDHPHDYYHAHGHDGGGEHGHADRGHDARGHDDHGAVHSHGGVQHSHLPAAGEPLTWRSLFALGLFGGLVPSINALIILLATLATGRAAYGLVLVVAFGTGMAIVLGVTGLGLVYASRWLARSPSWSPLGRLAELAPAITAVVIMVVGVVVTGQAILGSRAF